MTVPHKHCLLVVDDEPDVSDSINDLLRHEFQVLKAKSAAEGARLMQENEVHIVMTDQRMPKVTGVELPFTTTIALISFRAPELPEHSKETSTPLKSAAG